MHRQITAHDVIQLPRGCPSKLYLSFNFLWPNLISLTVSKFLMQFLLAFWTYFIAIVALLILLFCHLIVISFHLDYSNDTNRYIEKSHDFHYTRPKNRRRYQDSALIKDNQKSEGDFLFYYLHILLAFYLVIFIDNGLNYCFLVLCLS